LTYEIILLLKSKYKNLNFQKNIKKFLRDYDGAHLYITGDDLHRLGIAPGPDYRRILNKVLEAKLNGKVKTKKEELAMVISN
jgi:tRNA nucleotidyltransferase (CCA-adding enzyme)